MLLLDRSQEIIRRSASCQRDANFKVTPVNHSRSAEWREIGAWGVSGEVDLNRIPAPYEAYVDLRWIQSTADNFGCFVRRHVN